MKNDELICFFDMFAATQTILKPNGEVIKMAAEDLEHYIPQLCKNSGISIFHLYGTEDFLQGYAESILDNMENNYGDNHFEVLIN